MVTKHIVRSTIEQSAIAKNVMAKSVMAKSRSIIFAALIAFVALATSCASSDIETIFDIRSNSIVFSISPYDSEASIDNVNSLRAYRFDRGILQESTPNVTIDSEGRAMIYADFSLYGEVFLLGNATSDEFVAAENTLKLNETTIDEFRAKMSETTLCEQSNTVSPLFVASAMVSDMHSAEINLKRAFSAIDVDIDTNLEGSIEILSMRFEGVSKIAAPFNNGNTSITEQQTTTTTLNFSNPITSSQQNIYYINEGDYSEAINIVIDAVIDGEQSEVIRTLPNRISANYKYVIRIAINNSGGIVIEDWESQSDDESDSSGGDISIYIDESQSTLPDGVTISQDKSKIYTTYTTKEMNVKVICEEASNIDLTYSGNDNNFTITSLSNNTFKIAIKRTPISNNVTQLWQLNVVSNSKTIGHIEMERTKAPFSVSGHMVSYYLTSDANNHPSFNANTFADGDLLDITFAEEGYTVEVECDESGPTWLRIDPDNTTDKRFVVQGGWIPNDKDARGEVQSGRAIIKQNGVVIETYELSRQNHSLPVVYISGIWWCKFPMRGNRTSFADQILPYHDLADVDLYQYLKSCTAEEFFNTVGATYQGINLTPLTISKGSTVTTDSDSGEDVTTYSWQVTDGDTNATHIGYADPKLVSPGGYEIPTNTDILTHLWYGTWRVTGDVIPENDDIPTAGGYSSNGRRYRFQPYYRTNMTYDDFTYSFGYMEIADIGSSSNYDTNVVQYGPLVWASAGTASANGPGNFNTLSQRYAYASSLDQMYINVSGVSFGINTITTSNFATHTHRCIKSPNTFRMDE